MSRPTFAGTTAQDYRAPGKGCANVRRGDLPKYVASIPILRSWMGGWKNPTRAEQDALAEDIRLTRVAARVAIGLGSARVRAAYCAALRSFLLPGDALVRRATKAEAELWGLSAGARVRFALDGVTTIVDGRALASPEVGRAAIEARERCGNQNRGSAGSQTREALRLLGEGHGRQAALLDLAADPSCRALDAARELLQALGDDLTCREGEAVWAILEFERAVGRAQHALRGQVVEVLRLASMGDHLEGPFGGDALTGGAEGQRRAFRVYQRGGPGDLCLGSFARTHWIVQGAVRALRGVWTPTKIAPADHDDYTAAIAGKTWRERAKLYDPDEVASWCAARQRPAFLTLSLQHTVKEQGAHACEVGAGGQVARGEGVADNIVGDEGVEAQAEAAELPLVLGHVLGCLGDGAEPARAALAGALDLRWEKSGRLSKKTAAALPATLLRRLRDHVLRQLEPEIHRARPPHLGVWKPLAPAQIRTIIADPVRRATPEWQPWAELRSLCEQAFACPI